MNIGGLYQHVNRRRIYTLSLSGAPIITQEEDHLIPAGEPFVILENVCFNKGIIRILSVKGIVGWIDVTSPMHLKEVKP